MIDERNYISTKEEFDELMIEWLDKKFEGWETVSGESALEKIKLGEWEWECPNLLASELAGRINPEHINIKNLWTCYCPRIKEEHYTHIMDSVSLDEIPNRMLTEECYESMGCDDCWSLCYFYTLAKILDGGDFWRVDGGFDYVQKICCNIR